MLVHNPSIPFCSPIGGFVSPGTLIRIAGNVTPYSQCFAINLQCGGSVNPRDDVALHLSPVFAPPPRIVRNSIQNNSWGPEESFGGFPISPGQSFEFMILIEPNQFKIALNGNHFTEFRHRLPYERITHIAIDGDVRIDVVSVSSSGASVSSSMPGQPYPMGMGGMPPYPAAAGYGGGAPYPPMGFEMAGPNFASEPPPPYNSSAYPSIPPVSSSYNPSTYPAAGGYPTGSGGYPTAPGAQYPPQKSNSGLGGKVTAALGGLTAGVAATSIGSALLGNSNKHGHKQHGFGSHMPHIPGVSSSHQKSSSIPIGKIAAGAGAAALGAAVLSKVHPFKKAKKMFKHKHKGGWHHKGWSSSSSSSSSEEE